MGKVEMKVKPDGCLQRNREGIVSRKNSSYKGIEP